MLWTGRNIFFRLRRRETKANRISPLDRCTKMFFMLCLSSELQAAHLKNSVWTSQSPYCSSYSCIDIWCDFVICSRVCLFSELVLRQMAHWKRHRFQRLGELPSSSRPGSTLSPNGLFCCSGPSCICTSGCCWRSSWSRVSVCCSYSLRVSLCTSCKDRNEQN